MPDLIATHAELNDQISKQVERLGKLLEVVQDQTDDYVGLTASQARRRLFLLHRMAGQLGNLLELQSEGLGS